MKKSLKTILPVLFLLMGMTGVQAQEQKKFSPEKFEADMEAFITTEAALTTQEAAHFFPLFREMHQKQRAVYDRMRQAGKEKPANDKSASEVIKECDKLAIEAKQIEQQYHNKMLKELSPVKVYQAIKAENRFHRQMMKGWQKQQRGARVYKVDAQSGDRPIGRPKGRHQ